jgi:hypothetical protein
MLRMPGFVASCTLVEAVRLVRRCHPRTVVRRDRHGHAMRTTREVCRQMGPQHHR